MPHCVFYFLKHRTRKLSGRGPKEPVRIKRAQLKAKKNGFKGQATFRSSDPNIGRKVTGDILTFCANHNGNNKRQTIDRIY